MSSPVRHLYLVFGDQLDSSSPIFSRADPKRDLFWMVEATEEADYVWSHRLRLAFFFAAMRHYRDWLLGEGWNVHYTELEPKPNPDTEHSLGAQLRRDLQRLQPERVRAVEVGDFRVRRQIEDTCREEGVVLEWIMDSHFILPLSVFKDWAAGRKRFLLEDFYRMMRRRTGILMAPNGKPEGGEWNFDRDNREAFGPNGPPRAVRFGHYPADALTCEVVDLVNSRFSSHPGRLDSFALPVTRAQALQELQRFTQERLPLFGPYQDALWKGEHTLYHARLSALLNVKLLHPLEVVEAALSAYREGTVSLGSVEGFVRQIIGWREYVRGIYHTFGESYLDRNALQAKEGLPSFFWDGKTKMSCVRDAMENVLENGYAHHIQRLMVLGQFALLWGANPRAFHDWHMAMYLDAIDWVSAPNTIGMSQYADGGVVGTKPYCASGNYINRMSNYCRGCVYKPDQSFGPQACPFTTLYYAFLDRNRDHLKDNRRMVFQMKNLERKSPTVLSEIRQQAAILRQNPTAI